MSNGILEKLRGGLIVSCQALPEEPLHGAHIMARMAVAAQLGGAVGIRANGQKDIAAIKEVVDLPVIGLVKKEYPPSGVYITPTLAEVEEAVKGGAEIVAMDGTQRLRPMGQNLEAVLRMAKKRFPNVLYMADISTWEEGAAAAEMGFDLVGTTLCSYTDYTRERELPDFSLIRQLAGSLEIPVVAEGGIWTPEALRQAMDSGAYCAVVGTAITRPREITRRFVAALADFEKR